VKEELEELGVPVAEAARNLGVTRQQLYRVLKGDCGISADMAWRLEKAIGGSARLWLSMQATYDLAQLRKRRPQPKVRKLAVKAA
jgi:addiction module HigA family antidote